MKKYWLILLICISCQPLTTSQNLKTDCSQIKADAWIHIQKHAFTLSLMKGDSVCQTFPVVLGSDPVGDKRREGDKRTPEGTFAIRDLYPHARWTYFIWIDYPTADSWSKHQAAKERREIPQDAKIGGEIGIHGVPVGTDFMIDQGINWTLGCISLKNKDVKIVYAFAKKGMKVVIE
ncbi:MAG: L,D-transpeptidase [Bacteroidota bacterium]